MLEYKIIFTDKWKEALSPKKEDAVSIGFNILLLWQAVCYILRSYCYSKLFKVM